jgi:D-sedoheptulose 7-phosphate isomerase
MNAIILASGPGTRMLPWTATKNKVMFKVDGKPLLQYHIENLRRIGVKRIFITMHWKSPEMENQIISDILPNISYTKTKEIIAYGEKKLNGSGTAVTEIMVNYKLDRTIVIYGDTWFEPDYYDFIEFVYNRDLCKYIFVDSNQESANIAYNKYTKQVMKISESGKIEIDSETQSKGKNVGILILKSDIIGTGDLMKDVLPKYNSIYAICNILKWCDIGEIERYIILILSRYNNKAVNQLIENDTTTFVEFTKKILLANRIFIAGNGGSLSTAQHLALDWSKVGNKNAIALGEASVISAYGNDEGYENIFVQQLKCFNIAKNDVIVLLSGSGNSKNICKVMEAYPNNVIGMSGQTGQLLCECKLTLTVQSDNIRVIEDSHLAYGHSITEIMEGLA